MFLRFFLLIFFSNFCLFSIVFFFFFFFQAEDGIRDFCLSRGLGDVYKRQSWNDPEVRENPSLALDYIVAPPRMAHYIEWSTRIYEVYLKYAAPEDIHVYSIDEVFIDATSYLQTFRMTGREYARAIILDILKTVSYTHLTLPTNREE